MTVLLWNRRRQIGCCLLLQASLLGTGLLVEHWLAPTPVPIGAQLARTGG